jgi:hypothetical protein
LPLSPGDFSAARAAVARSGVAAPDFLIDWHDVATSALLHGDLANAFSTVRQLPDSPVRHRLLETLIDGCRRPNDLQEALAAVRDLAEPDQQIDLRLRMATHARIHGWEYRRYLAAAMELSGWIEVFDWLPADRAFRREAMLAAAREGFSPGPQPTAP